MIRTVLVLLDLLVMTPPFASLAILGALLRRPDRPGGVFDWVPRWWARTILAAGGVRVQQHDKHHALGDRHVFVVNHLSWFDVFAVAAHLRWFKFVAKAELFRIPLFGPAMRAAGMIPIARDNRQAALGSLKVARDKIAAGASVIVYPEGTRGRTYALRPFKKGAFVLAIDSQAPIVPVYVHGQLHVQAKGAWRIRGGTIHLHFLPPIPTEGLTYADRETLARRAYEAMAAFAKAQYGVESPPFGSRGP